VEMSAKFQDRISPLMIVKDGGAPTRHCKATMAHSMMDAFKPLEPSGDSNAAPLNGRRGSHKGKLPFTNPRSAPPRST
jgi:hypothetical protein